MPVRIECAKAEAFPDSSLVIMFAPPITVAGNKDDASAAVQAVKGTTAWPVSVISPRPMKGSM